MTILARVAKKTAEYETPLIVPCYDPIVMIVEKEIVRQAYTEMGKPDARPGPALIAYWRLQDKETSVNNYMT